MDSYMIFLQIDIIELELLVTLTQLSHSGVSQGTILVPFYSYVTLMTCRDQLHVMLDDTIISLYSTIHTLADCRRNMF